MEREWRRMERRGIDPMVEKRRNKENSMERERKKKKRIWES